MVKQLSMTFQQITIVMMNWNQKGEIETMLLLEEAIIGVNGGAVE